MKICNFCGTETTDSEYTCSSCGANEFSPKCGNCGTIIKDGNYCNNCGTKVGTKPKICPTCGTEYYSAACPNCGYIMNGNNNSDNAVYREIIVQEPVKKRKTWLWVLGWIIIFPVPLTILMLRNKDLKPIIKYGIIVLAWVLYLIIGFSNNSTEANANREITEVATQQEEYIPEQEVPTLESFIKPF